MGNAPSGNSKKNHHREDPNNNNNNHRDYYDPNTCSDTFIENDSDRISVAEIMSSTCIVDTCTELHSWISHQAWNAILHGSENSDNNNSNRNMKFKRQCRTWLRNSVQRTIALPIMLAIRDQNCPIEVIELLVESFPESLRLRDNSDGMLPLHWACWARQSDVVISFLCERWREAAHVYDKFGRLPIHIACEYGVPSQCGAEVINVLLHANPMSIQSVNKENKTPLDIVMEYSDEDEEYAPRQRFTGVDNYDCARAEVLAPLLQKKQLLQHSHSLNSAAISQHQSQRSLLTSNSVRESSSSYNVLQWTPSTLSVSKKLHQAHLESIKLHELIEQRNWKQALDHIKNRPDDVVVWFTSTPENIIGKESSSSKYEMVNNNSMPQHMFLPIHRACRQCPPNLFVIRALLKEYPNGIGCRDSDGMLPLHWACHGISTFDTLNQVSDENAKISVDLVRYLIKAFPGGVAIKDKMGRLPIHVICGESHLRNLSGPARNAARQVFKILADRDPQSLYIADQKGWKPIDMDNWLNTNGVTVSNDEQVATSQEIIKSDRSHISKDSYHSNTNSLAQSSVKTRDTFSENYSIRRHRERKNFNIDDDVNSTLRSVSSIEAIIKLAESRRSTSSSEKSSRNTSSQAKHETINSDLSRDDCRTESSILRADFKNEKAASNRSLNDLSSTVGTTITPSISTVTSEATSGIFGSSIALQEKTELYRLIEKRSWEMVLLRLDSRPDEAGKWYDSSNITSHPNEYKRYLPLHLACKSNPPERVVRLLVHSFPQAVGSEGNRGWLPLHYACAYHAPLSVIEYLVEIHPASLKCGKGKGGTPYEVAQYYYQGASKASVLDLLCKDPDSFPDSSPSGALFLAPIAEVELSSSDQSIKVRVQTRSPSPLLESRIENDSNILQACYSNENILNNTSVILKLIEGRAWEEAIERCELNPDEACRWNICYDIDGNCTTKQLPIHLAVMLCPPFELVDVLVKSFPAGVRMKDQHGRLPLHWACECSASSEIIEELLSSFPLSTGAIDNRNKTPLDCAEKSNHPSRVAIMTYMMMNAQLKDIGPHCAIRRLDNDFSEIDSSSSHENISGDVSNAESLTLSELFMYIETRNWLKVLHHLDKNPDEATFGCCKEGSFSAITILPLHRACQLQPPENVVRALIQAAPQALRFVGEDRKLPIHYACSYGASDQVIALLLEAFPSSVAIKANGKTPLEMAQAYFSQRGSKSEEKAVMNILLQQSPTCISEIADSYTDTVIDLDSNHLQNFESVTFDEW